MFMGACTIAPNFCIVTEWCEGSTLYNLLHIKDVKLSVDDILEAANETARGMGYGGSALADKPMECVARFITARRDLILNVAYLLEFEGSRTVLCIWYPILDDACLLQCLTIVLPTLIPGTSTPRTLFTATSSPRTFS
jgi:hypothetical protein